MSYQPPVSSPVAGFAPAAEIPLWAPYYGASFQLAVKRFFTKYADFTGRASRSEYWWTFLAREVVGFALSGINLAISIPTAIAQSQALNNGETGSTSTTLPAGYIVLGILVAIVGVGVLVPTLSVTWRRLHDVNLSGWFILLNLIPGLGSIIVLLFTVRPSDPAGARFDRPR
jgi:uncharacterized membrane protein YhaH (DUF805 family)